MAARLSTLAFVVFLGLRPELAFARLDEAGAKLEFEKATQLFEEKKYEAALPSYRKAYELSGHRPSTIRALAQCERALNLYDDAIQHFQEYLATRPEEAPQIVETLAFLQELRAAAEKAKREGQPPPPTGSTELTAPKPAPLPQVTSTPEPSVTSPTTVTTEVPEAPEDEGVSTTTIVLIAIGAAVVVGGGIALGFALSGEEDPHGGTSGTVLLR